MSDELNTDHLLAELQQPPQPATRGVASDAVRVGGLVADIANVVAAALPDDSRLGQLLRKLLDARSELLAALENRADPGSQPPAA
jgi:hypothetical protein